MASSRALLFALLSLVALEQALVHATFADDTQCTWGKDNCQINGDNLTLILNQWSGAAINGKKEYLFGFVDMQVQLVPDDSAGVVTTYYISSEWNNNTADTHDEVDFEFLGNVSGQPYTIHTNIFVNGTGDKEEQFKPWFDPTTGFHNYTIFWNPYMVLWSIDGVVIRVFKNYESKGILFPKYKPMKVYSSIWNADDWATQGGRVKTNWTYEPFIARYLNYRDSVCIWTGENSINDCESTSYWYMAQQYQQLSDQQITDLTNIRNNYMIYNYCTDTKRFNGNFPPECSQPQY